MSKFSVGEVCEFFEVSARSWRECTIVATGVAGTDWGGLFVPLWDDYIIDIPDDRSPNHPDGFWSIREGSLRKKRPPSDEWESFKTKHLTDIKPLADEPMRTIEHG